MSGLVVFSICFLFVYSDCSTVSTGLKLSCDQIRRFVDGHNQRRYTVAHGLVPHQPPASNMLFMSWDEELAEKATRWAENGIFGHNPNRTLGSKRWDLVGENIYISNYTSNIVTPVIPNIEDALDSWFNEQQDYGFEPFSLGTPKPIGHYTQLVWGDTNRVGCGISQRITGDCTSTTTSTLFVCNYGPTGNYLDQYPYKSEGRGRLLCGKDMCRRPYGVYCRK